MTALTGQNTPLPGVYVSSFLFVVVRDEAVEEAEAKGGGAFRHGRRVLFRPRHPGYVEMRPGHVVDEALEELRADDAAGATVAGDVLDVGRVAVDRAVVAVGERQPPQALADRSAGRREALGERVVVGEKPGMLAAQRDDDGAGQGREIHHQLRL